MSRETKSVSLLVRVTPTVKRHLERVSASSGYPMAVLVAAAIMKLRVSEREGVRWQGVKEAKSDGV